VERRDVESGNMGKRVVREGKRTILSASPELQMLLRMLAAMGVENVAAAVALVETGFCFEAAKHLLQQWECVGCGWSGPVKGAMVGGSPLRTVGPESMEMPPLCPRCEWQGLRARSTPSSALRQRIHRMQRKVREILGPAFDVANRRRASVGYAAEASGVYRTAVSVVVGEEETEP